MPAPLTEGSKLFPTTPVPEKVPPTGVPVKLTADAEIHIEATGEMVTTGNGLTITVPLIVVEQLPLAPVIV